MISGIDRTSFLALTFGIAACNTGPAPAVAVIDIPVQPPQPDGGSSAPIVKQPEPTTPKPVAISEPAAEGTDDDDDDMGTPTAEGGGVVSMNNYKGCGFVDPATVTRPAAGCSDDKAAVPACTPACSGFAFPRQKCEAYKKFLKPKVAAAAVACIAKLSASQQCDACKVYRCGDLAMKGSCPDPAADATCRTIAAKCPSLVMADCQRYLSGLTAAGRQQMTTCLTAKSGCGFGIFSCAEGLF